MKVYAWFMYFVHSLGDRQMLTSFGDVLEAVLWTCKFGGSPIEGQSLYIRECFILYYTVHVKLSNPNPLDTLKCVISCAQAVCCLFVSVTKMSRLRAVYDYVRVSLMNESVLQEVKKGRL